MQKSLPAIFHTSTSQATPLIRIHRSSNRTSMMTYTWWWFPETCLLSPILCGVHLYKLEAEKVAIIRRFFVVFSCLQKYLIGWACWMLEEDVLNPLTDRSKKYCKLWAINITVAVTVTVKYFDIANIKHDMYSKHLLSSFFAASSEWSLSVRQSRSNLHSNQIKILFQLIF